MNALHISEIKYEYCQVYEYFMLLYYIATVNKCAVFK
jgi:hypothetical protein